MSGLFDLPVSNSILTVLDLVEQCQSRARCIVSFTGMIFLLDIQQVLQAGSRIDIEVRLEETCASTKLFCKWSIRDQVLLTCALRLRKLVLCRCLQVLVIPDSIEVLLGALRRNRREMSLVRSFAVHVVAGDGYCPTRCLGTVL